MTNKDTIAGIVFLFLLYLLFRRKSRPFVSSILIDPITGFTIGQGETGIGEALIPPGIPNDIRDNAFQFAAANGEVSCPIGYSPVINPNDNKVYCILKGAV